MQFYRNRLKMAVSFIMWYSWMSVYLWYNTDVAPNLWQYWYDDIAGGNYYGWNVKRTLGI